MTPRSTNTDGQFMGRPEVVKDLGEDEPVCRAWLRRSLADLYVQDGALLRYRVGEWGATFRLALHLGRHSVG